MFFFDPLYLIFALPALLLGLYAQWRVQKAYRTYETVANARRITGAQAARALLQSQGLVRVKIENVSGQLSDHYDPSSKTLRLSEGVAGLPSVAALAIAAHEVGHAVQDARGYALLRLRGALVPAVTVGSWVGPVLFFAGLLLNAANLAWAGILLFAGAALFALVTLPVEFDASRRALGLLRENYMLSTSELAGAKAVLDAAALTYVAALAQSLSTLLYYAFVMTGLRQEEA